MANKLVEIVPRQAERYGDREAYRFCWRRDGEWLPTSWNEFAIQVDVAGKAIAELGLIEKDNIAVCSPNTPQILITELGAFRNRVAAVPIYASSVQSQFDFIVENSGAKVLFVGDSHHYPMAYNQWKKRPEAISRIVVFKNDGLELRDDDTVTIFWDDFVRLGMNASRETAAEVEARSSRGLPEDMATLIYTSGTTGEPKGVVITHSNYDECIQKHIELLSAIKDDDLSMAFLPMSHILEKAWDFFCVTRGITIAFNYDPRVIQDTIKEVEPNLMCCVPRFWEKVYHGVKEKIAGMSKFQRMMVSRAIRTGYRRNIDYVRRGRRPSWLLEKEYDFWNRRVFQLLKNAIGIPNPNFFPTAGAPLSDSIVRFMRSVGIEVIMGYGLSETTATVSCYPAVGYDIGTAGRPLPGIKVRIDDNGEILVKGGTVTPGYYNNPEANAAAFTDDGYFRTGDAGYFTPDGDLVLTERIKDLFKTSNGKYIAPQAIESRLGEDKYIEQVAVIGDQRKYVTAIIIPAFEALKEYARKKKIQYKSVYDLVNNSEIRRMIQERIDKLQNGFANYEKVKKFTLLPKEFSMETGELTNTLKIRRPVINRKYAHEIEAMYAQ